jgi:ribonuclease P/MRP protein subunit POP5
MTKPLLPSLRERNRYLVFELACSGAPAAKDVSQAIYSAATRLLGEVGASKISLKFVEYDETKKHGIIKVNHKSTSEARAALAVLTEAGGAKAAARTVGVSGTLKKAREKWVQREPQH